MALRDRLRDPGGQFQPGQFRQRLDNLPRSGFVQQPARARDIENGCLLLE